MRVKIKICGLTNLADAGFCVSAGADYLGFVFAAGPRRVTPEEAGKILGSLECGAARKVGVFVNESVKNVIETARFCGLDVLQFHGDEPPEYCSRFGGWEVFKAFRLRDEADIAAMEDYPADCFLLDSYAPGKYGGTGITSDWELAARAGEGRKIILSGGLAPENVERAISVVSPYAVDASSGLEKSPGIKDRARIMDFVKNVKSCQREAKR